MEFNSKRKKLLFALIVILLVFLIVPFKAYFIELTEPELVKAAESGDTKAQRKLSGILRSGTWVGRDYAEAYFWEFAAKRESPKWLPISSRYPPGTVIIDEVYNSNTGRVPRLDEYLWPLQKSWIEHRVRTWKQTHPDRPEVPDIKLYQDQAEQEDPYAYLILAKLYAEGAPNLEKNYGSAYFWFSLAINSGKIAEYLDYAERERTQVIKKLSQEELSKINDEIRKWHPDTLDVPD